MIFALSCAIAMVLVIWFRSDAFLEYCRLFHFNWLSHYKDYDEKKKNDVALKYFGYLRQYHNCFMVRLITCPVCLTVWLAVGLCLVFGHFFAFPAVFLLGLILFCIVDRLLG